jgi:hypothetical protein
MLATEFDKMMEAMARIVDLNLPWQEKRAKIEAFLEVSESQAGTWEEFMSWWMEGPSDRDDK